MRSTRIPRYLIEILAAEGFNSVRIMAPEQVREMPRPDESGCVVVAQVPLGRDLRDDLLTYIRSGRWSRIDGGPRPSLRSRLDCSLAGPTQAGISGL